MKVIHLPGSIWGQNFDTPWQYWQWQVCPQVFLQMAPIQENSALPIIFHWGDCVSPKVTPAAQFFCYSTVVTDEFLQE